LAKINVNAAWTIGTNGGEKVPPAEANEGIFHLTTIAGEEDSASPRTITNTQDITLF
jgi:hypothetical protein